MGRKIYRRDSNPGSIRGWPIIPMLHIYMVCLARLCKTHTYPVWGMTTLRQFRSTGPMRAPCSRGLSLGLLVPNVYWVLFFFVPGTLAAPCLTCFGFQPGCTFEVNGKCPLVEIPIANLAITAKAGVGGALVLQNAVSNKYNRVINREGLNSLQALMRRPFDGTPATITKTTTMKTILGWVQSNVCSLDWALMEYMELVETEIDGDERKRLMANYNMLSTAKTTITSVSSTLYSTSGIGVTLLLLVKKGGSGVGVVVP